jgi:hypothetical protein
MRGKKSTHEDELPTFNELQASFQLVISELVTDSSLDSFRSEYERLNDALRQSHEHNEALVAKCRELNAEITLHSEKVQAALRYSESDQRTIATLRSEFDKAWRSVELLHAREVKSHDLIESLRADLQNLAALAQEGQFFSDNPDAVIAATRDDVAGLKTEVASQHSQISSLTSEINLLKSETVKNEVELIEWRQTVELWGIEMEQCGVSLVDLDAEADKLSRDIAIEKQIPAQLERQLRDVIELFHSYQPKFDSLKSELFHTDMLRQTLQSEHREIEAHCSKRHVMLDLRRRRVQKLLDEQQELTGRLDERDAKIASLKAAFAESIQKIAQSKEEFAQAQRDHRAALAELSAARPALNANQDSIVALKRDVGRLEDLNRLGKRAIDVQLLREESLEQDVARATVATAAEKSRQEATELDTINVKIEATEHSHQASIELSEAARLHAAADVDRTEADGADAESAAIREERIALELRYRQILFQAQRKEIQCQEIRDRHVIELRKMRALTKETEAMRLELRSQKESLSFHKEFLTKTDNQCLEAHARVCIIREENQMLELQTAGLEAKLRAAFLTIEELSMSQVNDVHMLSESKIECTAIGNTMQRMRESIRWIEKEISKRTREIAIMREKTRVVEDTFRQNSAAWNELNTLIEQRESEMDAETARMRLLVQKVKKCRLVRREEFKLERQLLRIQAEATALEEETKFPMRVHRWSLLESANPQVSHLVAIRTTALDQLSILLVQIARLKERRDALHRDLEKRLALAATFGSHQCLELTRSSEVQLRGKTLQLARLMRESDEKKEEGDEWRTKIQTTKAVITEEREQFFTTKWKEAQVAHAVHPIREPPPLEFVGGQSPRPMIPYLRLLGPPPKGPATSRVSYYGRRTRPIGPPAVLPPLPFMSSRP